MSKNTSLPIERLEERLNAYNIEIQALTRKIAKHENGEVQMSPEKERIKLENRIKRLNEINKRHIPTTIRTIARMIRGFSLETPITSLSQGRDQ